MEITKHETQTGTIVISNPTAEAIKLAKQLEAKKNAKFRSNGDIVTFSAYRRDFEKMMPAVKPVAKPTPATPVITHSDLIKKLKEIRAENVEIQAYLETLNDSNDPIGIARVETKREISRNLKRLETVEKRIAGTLPESTITDEELELMDYVLSDKYNDD